MGYDYSPAHAWSAPLRGDYEEVEHSLPSSSTCEPSEQLPGSRKRLSEALIELTALYHPLRTELPAPVPSYGAIHGTSARQERRDVVAEPAVA